MINEKVIFLFKTCYCFQAPYCFSSNITIKYGFRNHTSLISFSYLFCSLNKSCMGRGRVAPCHQTFSTLLCLLCCLLNSLVTKFLINKKEVESTTAQVFSDSKSQCQIRLKVNSESQMNVEMNFLACQIALPFAVKQ